MKYLPWVLMLVVMIGCAAPSPEGEEPQTTDTASTGPVDGYVGEAEEEELEVPPEGSLPLSEIIASLEVSGHAQVVDAEFEDGVWEIEYVVGGEEYEILVDPMTGESLADEPEENGDD